MATLAALGGLFGVAFAAATVLPLQSEALLAALLLAGEIPAWLLLATATAGNVLGAVTNWALGRGIERFRDRRWFPMRGAQLDRAAGWYRRWGRWSLLLSWAPFVGDPITIAAGVLRERLIVFLLLVTVAKLGRYLVVAAAVQGFV